MNYYTDAEIDRIIKHRVCSRCYGDLCKRPAPDRTWEAVCPSCGDAWGGTTISRFTAEMRAQRSMNESLEVRDTLADLFPNPHAGRPASDILSELGL